MNQLISSILETEKMAEEIVKNAQTQAKELIVSAGATAEEIKNKAVNDFKAYRIAEIEKAEKTACEKYDEIIKAGKSKADALIEQAKVNSVKVADKIIEGIIR